VSKKSQGATEYLIILAIVIIIALIVVAVMGGVPGIGVGARFRASSSFWQTSDIAIPSYALSQDSSADDFNMTLRNNLDTSITINELEIEGINMEDNCEMTSLSSGQSITCSENDMGNLCNAAGDAFSLDVNIEYVNDETGASYTYNGEGHKLEGKCSN